MRLVPADRLLLPAVSRSLPRPAWSSFLVSPEGTALVKDIDPGAGPSFPFDLTNLNGTLLFGASDPTNGALDTPSPTAGPSSVGCPPSCIPLLGSLTKVETRRAAARSRAPTLPGRGR